MKKVTFKIFAALAFLLLWGCTRERFTDPELTDTLQFSVSLKERASYPVTRAVGRHMLMEEEEWEDVVLTGKETKAASVSILNGDAGVYAFHDSFIPQNAIFSNARYQFSGNKLLPYTPYSWARVGGSSVMFFSYAPYIQAGLSLVQYNSGGVDYPAIGYSVPDTAAEQGDLVVSDLAVPQSQYRQPVPLTYEHMLCAIQFRMGFKCTVRSISIKNVKSTGKYVRFSATDLQWISDDGQALKSYTADFGPGGLAVTEEQQMVVDGDRTFMLLPQEFSASSTALVELVYEDTTGSHTVTASLAGSSWTKGRKITYTLYKDNIQATYVYFDLALGKVEITDNSYSGYINVANTEKNISKVLGAGESISDYKFFVFQSNLKNSDYSSDPYNWKKTGYEKEEDVGNPEKVRIPDYPPLTVGGKSWGDYVTNNSNAPEVIAAWNSNIDGTGRKPVEETGKIISITGTSQFDVTIKDLYQTAEAAAVYFDSNDAGRLTLRLKGDNRLPLVTYLNARTENAANLVITSADGDGAKSGTLTLGTYRTDGMPSFFNNKPLIGPNTGGYSTYGIYLRGGTIFAGSPPVNNSIWGARSEFVFPVIIGGGVNSLGVVTISGGRVTAVASGTSPAIGGGGGYDNVGGPGIVRITGGEVYAYAKGIFSTDKSLDKYVPTAAIGGSSTFHKDANNGSEVTITGGYVYAESMGGTAIGGGNSTNGNAGDAIVNIGGDAIVVAKSVPGYANNGTVAVPASTAIGGGTSVLKNGGNATINITGGKLTSGSIGGGDTGTVGKKIGSANITISGSPLITGQFVMVKGASGTNTFTMSGGTIFGSDTSDGSYGHIHSEGGAVYMEGGSCTITGGTIRNCSATTGGAIYMTGGDFTMTGGTLSGNTATGNGGAVSVHGGDVTVSGGSIINNLADNGSGGGIYLAGGNFRMPLGGGGRISYNAANSSGSSTAGNGGGVCVNAHQSGTNIVADIISGEVANNTADNIGGGLCVIIDDGSADITIGKEGGTPANPMINDNSAALSGGGMSVSGKPDSRITIYSGTIKGNVSAYVRNEDIRNDGGTVTLVGSTVNFDVSYKTVFFHSNNDEDLTEQQLIVTNTNSHLVPPSGTSSWTKEFHELSGWNTKADGTGTSYTKDGKLNPSDARSAIMNIDQDVHLYAVWTPTSAG